MNRLILKYKYPITFAILAVLAWVVYRYFSMGGSQLITFVVVILILYLVNMLPIDGRAKHIVRIVVIVIGVLSLLRHLM